MQLKIKFCKNFAEVKLFHVKAGKNMNRRLEKFQNVNIVSYNLQNAKKFQVELSVTESVCV